MKTVNKILAACALAGLAGCATPESLGPSFVDAPAPDPISVPQRSAAIDRGEDNPVTVLPIPADSLSPRRLMKIDLTSSGIADIEVKGVNLREAGVLDALRMVTIGSKLAYGVTDVAAAAKPVTVYNLSGKLSEVIERICRVGGVYCAVENGVLSVKERGSYIVGLPPTVKKEDVDVIKGAIDALVEKDVTADPVGGTMIFEATTEEARKVADYLERVRKNRAILVFDVWIAELQYTAERATGIRWEELGATVGKVPLSVVGGPSALSSGATGFKAVYEGKRLSLDTLVEFLGRQGKVNTIAAPQISLASGTASKFVRGGKMVYVKEVTVVTSGLNNPTVPGLPGSGTSTNSNAIQTDTLDTGLTLDVGARYHDGVIYTNFDLKLTELVRFDEVDASGSKVKLPETSERSISNWTPLRPGDVMLMAGIRTNKTSTDTEGLPAPNGPVSVPLRGEAAGNAGEIIVMMKPRVIIYEPEDAIEAAKANDARPANTAASAPTGRE